jgi:hypothetical protein
MAKLSLRCSSLDRLWRCPPSILNTDIADIQTSDPTPAGVGSTVHDLMAQHILTGDSRINTAMARYNLSEEYAEEVRQLWDYGVWLWNDKLAGHFPDPQCEVPAGREFDEFDLRGTVDVISHVGDKGMILLDWKTGRLEGPFTQQTAAYAYLAWAVMGFPRPEDATTTVVTTITAYLRLRYYRVAKYTARMLDDWMYDLTHNVLGHRETYQVSDHCAHCPKQHGCPARRQLVVSAVQGAMMPDSAGKAWRKESDEAAEALVNVDETSKYSPPVAEAARRMLATAEILHKVADDMRSVVSSAVQRVGPIPLGDDMEVASLEYERRKLSPVEAIPVLRHTLSDAQIADAMTLSITSLLAAAAANKPRGTKEAAKLELTTALEDAGAITRSPYFRLVRRASDQPIIQPENPNEQHEPTSVPQTSE